MLAVSEMRTGPKILSLVLDEEDEDRDVGAIFDAFVHLMVIFKCSNIEISLWLTSLPSSQFWLSV